MISLSNISISFQTLQTILFYLLHFFFLFQFWKNIPFYFFSKNYQFKKKILENGFIEIEIMGDGNNFFKKKKL